MIAPPTTTTTRAEASGEYSLAIGGGARALSRFSVALGNGIVAKEPYQVVIGSPCLCAPDFTAAWQMWNSPWFLSVMEKHRSIHTPKEFADMVEWMEYYFHGSRMLSLPKME